MQLMVFCKRLLSIKNQRRSIMVLIKISPVILMVLIGFFCRKTEMITTEGMEGLKTLATSLMLPVLLFHTLATTEYTSATIAVMGIMLLALSAAFIIGMLIKRAVPSAGIFFPFLVTSFEGGMLGYPLYAVLCGEARLSNIATLDIANTIFVFTVFLAFLTASVNGKVQPSEMISNVLHSPVFWGVFLGIAVGVTGVAGSFLNTMAGALYTSAKDMITSALSAVILVVVGYGLSFDRAVLKKCGKAVAGRMVIQGAILAVIMILLKDMFATAEMKTALILYLFLPPTFVIPAYAKTEEDGIYLSTTISLYSVFTIAIFILLTINMKV